MNGLNSQDLLPDNLVLSRQEKYLCFVIIGFLNAVILLLGGYVSLIHLVL